MKKPIVVCIAVSMVALLAGAASAETEFLTNNTTNKTLAANQGDAAALEGASSGTVTPLTLSADDGGGTITLTSVNVSGGYSLGMDSSSMGHYNEKWGANQNWTFTFDQAISFNALNLAVSGDTMTLRSTAWVTNDDASGSGWSFTTDGTYGLFSISGTGVIDLTNAGISDVPADTEIGFGFFGSANGGEKMFSFTITPVVIPPSGTVIMIK